MNVDQLRYQINQIARNLEVSGTEIAVTGTVQHVIDFWDSRMKAALLAAGETGLSPIAAAAAARLAALSPAVERPDA